MTHTEHCTRGERVEEHVRQREGGGGGQEQHFVPDENGSRDLGNK